MPFRHPRTKGSGPLRSVILFGVFLRRWHFEAIAWLHVGRGAEISLWQIEQLDCTERYHPEHMQTLYSLRHLTENGIVEFLNRAEISALR